MLSKSNILTIIMKNDSCTATKEIYEYIKQQDELMKEILDIIKESFEYLNNNKLNKICSTSILHKKWEALIQKAKQWEED